MHSGKRKQALQRCNLPRDTRVLAVIFSQAVRSSTFVGGRFFTARRCLGKPWGEAPPFWADRAQVFANISPFRDANLQSYDV